MFYTTRLKFAVDRQDEAWNFMALHNAFCLNYTEIEILAELICHALDIYDLEEKLLSCPKEDKSNIQETVNELMAKMKEPFVRANHKVLGAFNVFDALYCASNGIDV